MRIAPVLHTCQIHAQRTGQCVHLCMSDRLQDESGAPLGPYRVWFADTWAPGLAMSRAIGDVLAKQYAVFSLITQLVEL